MKLFASICLLFLPALSAADVKYWLSLGALTGANAADAISSRGAIEANPILGQGPFGARQCTIKFGVVAAIVGTELLLPRHRRLAAVMNYAGAGAAGAAAARNIAIRGRRSK